MFPTEKNDLISYKISISLTCKFISNQLFTFHFFPLSKICIATEKQPSASEKPVIQSGFIPFDKGFVLTVVLQ